MCNETKGDFVKITVEILALDLLREQQVAYILNRQREIITVFIRSPWFTLSVWIWLVAHSTPNIMTTSSLYVLYGRRLIEFVSEKPGRNIDLRGLLNVIPESFLEDFFFFCTTKFSKR